MLRTCSLHLGKFLKGKLQQQQQQKFKKKKILLFFPQIGTETFLVSDNVWLGWY